MHTDPQDFLPDVHDGLTHRERVVLQCLYELQMFEATPEKIFTLQLGVLEYYFQHTSNQP
jgi:hypothetical protein